ncbi:YihY/virulence factor BrkB family protein [Sphingosinicella sp. LY1275]|uniref:YihY/virulence factor BrkB family protein n=1 Tax=Sphingosinicella sp. LY1275 TaxID=3095379 RepID=UPI002ADEAD75|nr:YihY/virulence factor BrkB family protein [Sphingosinicella sp. LY1275]MEA1014086.1 YihY/virulence factor BrkB family protein [Sphingosinicella sp. LY1275]
MAASTTECRAATPAQISGQGWKQVLVRTWKEASRDNLNLIAAGVAFYAFLAFVPLLGILVLTYGLVADPASVVEHFQALTRVMPPEVARIVGEQMQSMVGTATGQKGFALLLALLIAIYGAMRGAKSIITALNVVYGVAEDRGFLRTTALAVLITLGAVVALLAGIIAISALAALEALLPFSSPFVRGLLKSLFWIAAAAAVTFVIAVIYGYAPNRPKAKWRWISPGSIAATLVWLAATLGFGFYVANFGSYNATYGSLGAVIVFLTWLYLSAYILLIGAELNAELEKQTACDTTGP